MHAGTEPTYTNACMRTCADSRACMYARMYMQCRRLWELQCGVLWELVEHGIERYGVIENSTVKQPQCHVIRRAQRRRVQQHAHHTLHHGDVVDGPIRC